MNSQYQETSIIVLALNQLHNLTRPCLESILDTCQATPFELVLVDNGSTDGTTAYFQQLAERLGPERVKVHSFAENVGIVAGRIKGMELASREFVLFLDNDTLATQPGWLGALQQPLHRDSSLAVVGQTGYHVIILSKEWTLFVRCPSEQGRCDVVQGYCMMFRARPYREGLVALDPDYGMLWHDESDLCMQFRELGLGALYMDAGIDHRANSTIRASCGTEEDLIRAYADRTGYFSKKWFGRSRRGRAASPANGRVH